MKKFVVEVSARHIHLNRKAVDMLFGKGYELTLKKELSQKGQFVCKEKVLVVGQKSSFKVSVLAPEREFVQLELSKTDARTLGIAPPIRESNNLNGSAACKLVGPKGEINLKEGVIVAKRHIHVNFEEAAELGVTDGENVCVEILSEERAVIFKDVVVRVSEDFSLAMHIDTDEANAANVIGSCEGKIFNSK